MKKDMGGAANVLGLASMIMAAGLKVRLRVLIPAVENAIAGNAFRPGDVLTSRKGITVEIGNTDAEGRLILADALALADEEEPELLIDMATLTGAARVALGPDLPPFYTDDDALAPTSRRPPSPSRIRCGACRCGGPMTPGWRRRSPTSTTSPPTVSPARSPRRCSCKRFVEKAASWAHFDIFAWNPSDRPHGPAGGEAQGIRALERIISSALCLTRSEVGTAIG